MKDILNNSMFFGVLVSILAYEVGVLLKKNFYRDHYFDPGRVPY